MDTSVSVVTFLLFRATDSLRLWERLDRSAELKGLGGPLKVSERQKGGKS